jgi:hypothetical protein
VSWCFRCVQIPFRELERHGTWDPVNGEPGSPQAVVSKFDSDLVEPVEDDVLRAMKVAGAIEGRQEPNRIFVYARLKLFSNPVHRLHRIA